MNNRSDIRTELESISKLVAGIPEVPVFTVPEGYFESFPALMLLKVKALDMDAAGEISELSPLLASLSRKMPMRVPDGYFEEIRIPEENETTQAPVVAMRKKPFRDLAIAASFIVMLGFAAMLLSRMDDTATPDAPVNVSAELPKVGDNEMSDFLNAFPDLGPTEPITVATSAVDVEDMISDIDEEGLKDFLQDLPEIKNETLN